MPTDDEDQQQQGEEKPFAVERAKTGRAKCKKCKCPIEKDEIRIAKYVTSFFSDGKLMPAWHHVTCLFEAFAKQRASTKRIEDPAEDVKGWEQLSDDDKKIIQDKLEEFEKSFPTKTPKKAATPRKAAASNNSSGETAKKTSDQKRVATDDKEKDKQKVDKQGKSKVPSKDDSFREFRRVCSNVADVDAYTDKTAIIKRMFTKGSLGDGFKGDIVLWCKLLLPGAVKRIYNLQSKQLIKLFARLLLQDEDAMLEHLEQGDVAETISVFFENSAAASPCAASVLTIQDVDLFLKNLSRLTKEEEQIQHFRSILDKCTANDLKMIIRLIKHDLRINAGPKHINKEKLHKNKCHYRYKYRSKTIKNNLLLSMLERRNILKDRMTEIPNRITLSEVHEVHDPQDLAGRIVHVLKLGLEGLVLKDIDSKYEPGKRHWLKVKKDYLCGGAMADSADLVVLGAWYGTGNKGGMLSVFLMGCYDEKHDKWLTVTKVHTGHDDATLTMLQDQLDMVKIGKDVERLPSWLHAKKPMVPDFVAKDPKEQKQPVWEITGAEFTNQGVHTADGISIRFPRVTRIRHDKDWSTATTLDELRVLFKRKPESVDFGRLLDTLTDVKTSLRKKSFDPTKNTSPKKIESSRTNFWDEPSTSSRAKKELPKDIKEEFEKIPLQERTLKRRKGNDCDKESFDKVRLEKKKLKREIKGKTENSSSTKLKKEEKSNSKMEGSFDSSFDASSIDSNDEVKKFSNVLQEVRASLAPDFDTSRKKDTRRKLKTLGATIVTLANGHDSTATHVIHTRAEIPSSAILGEYAVFPRTVRHVNVSWLEETAAQSRRQDEVRHAIQLAGDYCDCPCTHR
ncbi:PREDICTED: DNA ligase 3 [Atta cephalotes]|uniref:DNA ligase (ATP) n=1 Tax=Atta cephalotes TaxID=12957 RepID=A0A158NMA8_ATTCE|nr:PREDICTED: DNA ligase 3 [Atta cephalotes]